MSNDSYKVVTDYPVSVYHCGARVGDRVRLRRDIVVRDHHYRATGKVHCAGEIWAVLRGTIEEPPIIWLRQPDGTPHTWSDDEDFLQHFEVLR